MVVELETLLENYLVEQLEDSVAIQLDDQKVAWLAMHILAAMLAVLLA